MSKPFQKILIEKGWLISKELRSNTPKLTKPKAEIMNNGV